jgi:hypothetical protein
VPQPALGLAASGAVIALSLGFISLFDFGRFAGTVSFFLLCLIPMQVVAVVLWQGRPPVGAGFPQPGRGLILLLMTVLVAAVIAPVALAAVGQGIEPPGPIPSHFVIIVVPTAFFLAIVWGGWPFSSVFGNSLAVGLAVLASAYLVTYAIFRGFFDYEFLRAAPVYLASAPHGLFNGVTALVFYVTCLAAMFLVLCFDLWPLTSVPTLMKQPLLGLVWTVVAVAAGGLAFHVGVTLLGADPMIFLTRVTAPFIFGCILVLNMLQDSLFANRTQPVKGLLNAMAAMVIGIALAQMYGWLAPVVTGNLPSGPPGYEYEIWLANALLSVTFPFLIFHAVYLEFWPLRKVTSAAHPGESRRRRGWKPR